jgi:K+-transporting ATPase ATPase B chain
LVSTEADIPSGLRSLTATNDVATYFAIILAMFAATFPVLMALNVLRLRTPL